MSDKDRSKDDDGNGGGVGGCGGGDDEDGEERKISNGCRRRGKRVTLFQLRRGKKMMGERREEKGVYANSRCWWRRRSKIPGSFLCLKEPETLDSSAYCWDHASSAVMKCGVENYEVLWVVVTPHSSAQPSNPATPMGRASRTSRIEDSRMGRSA